MRAGKPSEGGLRPRHAIASPRRTPRPSFGSCPQSPLSWGAERPPLGEPLRTRPQSPHLSPGDRQRRKLRGGGRISGGGRAPHLAEVLQGLQALLAHLCDQHDSPVQNAWRETDGGQPPLQAPPPATGNSAEPPFPATPLLRRSLAFLQPVPLLIRHLGPEDPFLACA